MVTFTDNFAIFDNDAPEFGLGCVVKRPRCASFSARASNTRPARLSPPGARSLRQILDIFETAVDRGKTDIGDFIELFNCSITRLPIILLGTSRSPGRAAAILYD